MKLLGHLEYVLVYTDNVLIIQKEGELEDYHLNKLQHVLAILQNTGFRTNLRKSFFLCKNIEYLDYQLTSGGLNCQTKKIDAMKCMLPPTNVKQLKRFIRMVNFYRDVFPRQSHILAPLSDLEAKCGKRKGSKTKYPWSWKIKHQRAFDNVNKCYQKKWNWLFSILISLFISIPTPKTYNLEQH